MEDSPRIVFLFFTGLGILLSGMVVLSEILAYIGIVKKDEDE